jgi:hypothetical protein
MNLQRLKARELYQELKISFDVNTIEASSRTLAASFSLDALKDIKTLYSLPIIGQSFDEF